MEKVSKETQILSANTSTGIFCQPGCAVLDAGQENNRDFESARDALAAGFRPCRECKPLNLGASDPQWLEDLASAVDSDPARRWHDRDLDGMGLEPDRVRRWFIANHGLTFHAYARLRRMGLALRQIQHGTPMSEALLAHGYESEKGFREAFSLVFGNPHRP